MNVAHFYDWLARFQDWARAAGHDTGREALTVHRRLRDGSGAPSGATVHTHLLAALHEAGGVAATPRVLDAGCGLGGTTFFLQAALGGEAVGITLSDGQRRRAAAEAARRGLSHSCRFAVRSYDDDLSDLLPSGADLVVAIESLAHAPDPAATLVRLAGHLRPGGSLVVVDDMPADALGRDDADFVGFRRGWMCAAIAPYSAVDAAMRAAGLHVAPPLDLTSLVTQRPAASRERLIRLNLAAQAVTRFTPARTLVESFHGGLMLERLYARGLMRYRLVIGRRPAA